MSETNTKKKGFGCQVIPKPLEALETPVQLADKIGTYIVPLDPKYIPQYKTEGASCCDLVARGGPFVMPFRGLTKVPVGFSLEVPFGYEAVIRLRSGLAAKGVVMPNAPGTIDSDYRGEVEVLLINCGREIITIREGDRFAQMKIQKSLQFNFLPTTKLSETNREGGFGSTGV